MISIDTNVLVYAHRADLPQHAKALEMVSEALAGGASVALCWPVIHEFVAVVTNARAFRDPTPAGLALDQVEDWISSPSVTMLSERRTHLVTMRGLLGDGAAGGLVHDARIAAICLDSGVRELWTCDRDFGRFEGLRVRDPLG